MGDKLIELTNAKASSLATQEGISLEQIKDLYMMNNKGNVFIKRAGLLYKMNQKYQNNYSMRAVIHTLEEINTIKTMLGISNDQPFVIMKGIIEVDGQVFQDYGSAHAGNTYNKNYLFEMASTRATNRALRMATECGFTSVEEMHEEKDNTIKTKNINKETKEIKPDSNNKDINVIESKMRNILTLIEINFLDKIEILQKAIKKYGIKKKEDWTEEMLDDFNDTITEIISKEMEDTSEKSQDDKDKISDLVNEINEVLEFSKTGKSLDELISIKFVEKKIDDLSYEELIELKKFVEYHYDKELENDNIEDPDDNKELFNDEELDKNFTKDHHGEKTKKY